MDFGIPEAFELTDGELLRDEPFIDSVLENHVLPLVKEIDAVIDGYAQMGVEERFETLAVLNEQQYKSGGGLLVALDEHHWFEAYAGHRLPRYKVILGNDPNRSYSRPLFVNDMYGASSFESVPDSASILPLKGSVLLHEFINGNWKDSFAKLPPVYKVALLAKYVNQNVSTSIERACRFVISGEKLTGIRLNAKLVLNRDGKQNGYLFRVGDTCPTDKFWNAIAEHTRRHRDRIAKLDEPYVQRFGEDVSRIESKPRIRDLHPSTVLLLTFIEDYIPSTGYYVGRNKSGDDSLAHMSWKRAFELYNEKYSEGKYWVEYKDEKDMADRYQKAAKRRNAIESRWEGR